MPAARFAIFGTGFWSRYQLAGWREVGDVQCVGLYNRTRVKAEALARQFALPADIVFDDPAALLRQVRPDFVDVISDQATHHRFVMLCAEHRVPVICQKPFAATLERARQMLSACEAADVPLLIHENWRWQRPIRELHRVLAGEEIGQVFRCRIHYCNSFPVFDNQPFLRELPRFILMDIGTHILDTARFLFGEAAMLLCTTHRINAGIRGEDAASVLMSTDRGITVSVEMSYASRTEHERFPQTFFFIEGDGGSVELTTDYWLRVTTREGTHARRVPLPRYAWADPVYDVVHASIVDCNRDLLAHLRGRKEAETTGRDNLRTLELVEACYASAERGASSAPVHEDRL
jgi:D-apiose dehydrogenase